MKPHAMNKNRKGIPSFKGTGIKKGTFKRLLKYIGHHYKASLIVVAICILIGAAANLVSNIFLQKLIDECITPGISLGLDTVWKTMVIFICSMAAIYILGVLCSFLSTRIMANVTQGTLKNFRVDMFNKMQTLPIKYFDTHAHGDIMSTYTNDTDAIRQLIGQSLPTLFQSAFLLITMFFIMLYYSLWLTLIVIAVIVLMFLISKKIGGKSAVNMMKQQKTLATEEGFVEEMIKGQKVVKVFCHENENKKKFDEFNNELFTASEKAHTYGNILMPILGNIGNFLYVIVAFAGGLLILFDAVNVSLAGIKPITIGIIVSFLTMSRQLSQAISSASMQLNMVSMGLAGAGRIFDLIDQEPEQDEGYVSLVNAEYLPNGELTESKNRTGLWAWKHYHKADNTVTYKKLNGDIELENVTFGYTPEKIVLHNISLHATPGQKFAFVGATGAGKTTITNLINRFYDIQDGKIRFDGINIKKINKVDLRRSLGIVLQDTSLFTGSVIDNIRYGRLDASDEDCIIAAKLANAHDFITRLPDGYKTQLKNNGANLSQGQRQLLAIVRAAVADTPAMILDEATSSIDTRTESLVQAGMDNLMKGRTVFVIAHRLSTVQNADAIIVLEHGRIIERGNHNELIKQKGQYYQLYTGAFELE